MTVTKHVDLNIYRSNLRMIAKEMAPARVMAVIKADGFGHGLEETARAATEAGIDFLGVLDIETGIALRRFGIDTPAFAWLHSPQSDFSQAVFAGIELSAGSISELELIAAADGCAQVHLKIDTGLSRNGCRPEHWYAFVARAMQLQKAGEIDVVAIWSHLSGTSKGDDVLALELFEQATLEATSLGFSGYRHVASSPAAFGIPQSRFDLVRIGVSAVGTSPIDGVTAKSLGLGVPMKVTCEVLAPGVISIGFLHGYFGRLSGLSKVSIAGKPYRVEKIGPLASQIESGDYAIGDEVVIFDSGTGDAPTAEELCALIGTVTDELFTGLKTNLTTYSN